MSYELSSALIIVGLLITIGILMFNLALGGVVSSTIRDRVNAAFVFLCVLFLLGTSGWKVWVAIATSDPSDLWRPVSTLAFVTVFIGLLLIGWTRQRSDG